jgi:hypothetical protein
VKLDRNEAILGFSIKQVRDFVNEAFYDDSVSVSQIERCAKKYFGLYNEDIIDRLRKRGWFKKNTKKGKSTYDMTQLGKQARIAKLIARFPRAVGDKIVADLLLRVADVNGRHTELCWHVKELRLFGSMLDPSAAMLGDVDVAFALGSNEPPRGMKRSDWHMERYRASGRSSGGIFEQLGYAEREVMLILKNKNAKLSLHTMDDLDAMDTPSRIIFTHRTH